MNKFSFKQPLVVFILILVAGLVGIISVLPGLAQTTTTTDSTTPTVPTNVSVTPTSTPITSINTPVPGAGAPEPLTNEVGTWSQVDVASGQIVGGAVCTRAVCGINGEWHGYVPPGSYAVGAIWWPTSKRYIWQLPGQAGYNTGTFNFNTYIFTVSAGTIYNGKLTPTVAAPTPTSITTPTPTSTSSPTPTPTPTPTPNPFLTPTPTPTPTTTETLAPAPFPTSTPISQSTSTSPAPLGQCLQAGGIWCYSDFPTNLLGYCAPAKSACERGDQAPRVVLPQPPAVGLRAPTFEEKNTELQNQNQFLTNRRAVLQDLRELERLVKRNIIEIDAKQLKIYKEKILSLQPGDEGGSSVLQAYQEQIASLHGDIPTGTERESIADPRQAARALQQLKQGVRLLERHIATIEKKVAQIEKSKITIDVAITETITAAKDLARRVKKATSYNDIRDIAEHLPDVGQALNDALPRLEELLRLPRVLRLVERRIAKGETAIKQANVAAKRLKLEVTDKLEAMRGLITEAKSALVVVKTGGATEGLLDTLQEQVFDTLDDVFNLADHIRAVASVQQAINQATANVKRYEVRLRRLPADSEDRQTASELLGKFKEQLAGLKELAAQKLTPDRGDQIIDHLNVMADLKTELEDVFGLSLPEATQEEIKRLFSAPGEKIKPFKVEQLEQGVL